MSILRTLASALAHRAGLGGRDGLSFGSQRNLYEACGYPRQLSAADYRDMYERNGVAHRLVEAAPTACWRGLGSLYEDPDPNVITPWEQAWKDLDTRLRLWSTFQKWDVCIGLGRYGLLLLGAPGELDQPLEKIKPSDLMYVQPFTEADAPIQTFDVDFTSPRFGLPVFYGLRQMTSTSLINPAPEGSAGRTLTGRPVHFSRIIHCAEGALDNRVWGQPRLAAVYNTLLDLAKVTGGGAEAFWKRSDGGMQISLDPEIQLDDDAIRRLDEEVEDYTNSLTRVMRTRGVTIQRLGSDVADFQGPVNALFDIISSATSIPKRVLMGSERGHLSSQQDATAFDQMISDRRLNVCAGGMVRPFVNRLIELGALPKPQSKDGFRIEWPEVAQMDLRSRVRAAVQLSKLAQDRGQVITAEEIREQFLNLPPLTAKQRSDWDAREAKNQMTKGTKG